MPMMFPIQTKMFQSTYLYKVRLMPMMFPIQTKMFQSTYLYKVRLVRLLKVLIILLCFNPRTYIRYDPKAISELLLTGAFQSTYLYKVRPRPFYGPQD